MCLEGKTISSSYLSFLLCSCGFLLPANVNTIVLEIPLLERRSINLNNGTLHQSLSTNQFIVRCIVHHIKNSGLSGHSLTAPWVVSSIKPQSTPLYISSSNPNPPDCLVAWQFSACRLPSEFIPSNRRRHESRSLVKYTW